MTWKGRDLRTIGDLMNHGIDACATREEAQEFMRLYRAENEHADANIGYLSGYYGPTAMQRIQDWFGVAHPVFGHATPTPEEALTAGNRMAAVVGVSLGRANGVETQWGVGRSAASEARSPDTWGVACRHRTQGGVFRQPNVHRKAPPLGAPSSRAPREGA